MARQRLVLKSLTFLSFAVVLSAQPAFAGERSWYPAIDTAHAPNKGPDDNGQVSAVRFYAALLRLDVNSDHFAKENPQTWMGKPRGGLLGFFGFRSTKEQDEFYGDLKMSAKLVTSPGATALLGHRPNFLKAANRLLAALNEGQKNFDGKSVKADIKSMIKTLEDQMGPGLGLKDDAPVIREHALREAAMPYQREVPGNYKNGTDLFRSDLLDMVTAPFAQPVKKADAAPAAQGSDDVTAPTPPMITDTTPLTVGSGT